METEITCPDCGRVIVPKGTIEEARRCRCNDPTDAKDDTDTIPTNVVAASATKTCYICGADLAGRVRLKDAAGNYWCKQCASQDKKKKRFEERHKCADCSRPFPPEKLKYFQNARVCATCFKEREQRLEKKVKKQAAVTIHDKHEKKRLIVMAIVVVVILGAAFIWNALR